MEKRYLREMYDEEATQLLEEIQRIINDERYTVKIKLFMIHGNLENLDISE